MFEHTRTLDFKIAFAIGLGTMIAAGIFSLSGMAVYRIGSSAVIAFILAAIVAGMTEAPYSEFASINSQNGVGYLFPSRTFEEADRPKYATGASLFLGNWHDGVLPRHDGRVVLHIHPPGIDESPSPWNDRDFGGDNTRPVVTKSHYHEL